jgi:predicted permease
MAGEERGPVIRPDVDEEVSGELELHLEVRARDLVARGWDPAAARVEALRRFGDVEEVRRACRAIAKRRERRMSAGRWASELVQDARYGARQLVRNRGFAAVAVLTLAIGIGASTAIFSMVQGVLLRPLPYPGAQRLVVPQSQSREDPAERWSITYADYEDWVREGVFAHAAAHQRFELDLSAPGMEPERVSGVAVTADFFETLGVAPALGRFPAAEEFTPGTPLTVVISHGLWQRAFGGARDAVGRPVSVGGNEAMVIGVVPAGLEWPRDVDVWAPHRQSPAGLENARRRDNFIYSAIARLAPGRSLEETRALLDGLAGRVAADHPVIRADVTVTARPVADWLAGDELTRALWMLLAAVGVVLLIACANVANLLLGRSAARVRELSIRRSLGAGGRRLTRQLLTESVVLAAVGALAGVALAWAGLQALVALAPASIPRLEEIAIDRAVLGFAVAVTVAAALLFGLAPAVQASHAAAVAALRAEARATAGRRARRLRDVLVAAELALSLVVLVAAGLLVQSLDRLRNVDPGFAAADLLTFSVALPRRYAEGGVAAPFRSLLDRVRTAPGVEGAALASSLPLGGGGFYLGRAFLPEGRPEPPAGEEVSAQWVVVSPRYFAVMRIPLLRGREFGDTDTESSVPVMIVNRAFATAMFGDEASALGRRVRSWRDENVYREVVGVTGDVRFFGAGDEIQPLVYVPHPQSAWSTMAVVARVRVDPGAAPAALRSAVASFDPALAVADLQTMDDVFADSVAPQRFGTLLLAGFALLALVLAAIGIYGVLSYAVAQRTREIGVRIALGAERAAVLRMVLGEAAAVVAAGVALGAAGGLAVTRLMTSLLFETSATDPATFASTAGLLVAVAFVASWLPARRATRIDPVAAIRGE